MRPCISIKDLRPRFCRCSRVQRARLNDNACPGGDGRERGPERLKAHVSYFSFFSFSSPETLNSLTPVLQRRKMPADAVLEFRKRNRLAKHLDPGRETTTVLDLFLVQGGHDDDVEILEIG